MQISGLGAMRLGQSILVKEGRPAHRAVGRICHYRAEHHFIPDKQATKVTEEAIGAKMVRQAGLQVLVALTRSAEQRV